LLKVPVVTLNMQGNYLQSPIWNTRIRREARLKAQMTLAVSAEEAKELSAEEILSRLSGLLSYDEYRYHRENRIAIGVPWMAEGFYIPLYQCPVCGHEFEMDSQGDRIFCRACGSAWE